MLTFNKTINIEVDIDVIALQLRSMFKEDSAHADVVVEQIIGRALYKDSRLIGRLMSAMNGVQKEVIVQIGKSYDIKPINVYAYWTPESIEKQCSVEGVISHAKVIDINKYSDDEVKIEYTTLNRKGEYAIDTKWVSASIFTV